MSLGTSQGQKKTNVLKIVIVSAVDNCQYLDLNNVGGPRPFVCPNHINDIAMLGV